MKNIKNGMFNMSRVNNQTNDFRLWTHILQNMYTIVEPEKFGMSILPTIHVIESNTRQ